MTAGKEPLTVHRHVSSGSSFGANPLQQTIGLAGAERVALLEIHWPASGTTQVFRDIAADQAIEVTEFAETYRPLGVEADPAAGMTPPIVRPTDQSGFVPGRLSADFVGWVEPTDCRGLSRWVSPTLHRSYPTPRAVSDPGAASRDASDSSAAV